ncbi:type II secretion system protein [Paraneptunicella aestuarii]|uniref:type IV pilus modification PilV family protein n=1 Tax=Paraneptunicella aestuarii TaxID=2831148 RepID=UPI001E442A1F|nr:prepilin-type N-terminal cleavage/methylation domain-containing protein [Paraneptunicella aestuarii]UAA39097.1 type II secretion system protein [Paraneptunicella aestuarii]
MQENVVISFPEVHSRDRGFTLIEMVIGIVAFSAVLTIILSVVTPQAVRSVDPIFNVRAAELAQSTLNEISSKFFDENSNRTGGVIRCHEDFDGDGAYDNNALKETECTAPASLGPDLGENDREAYDDVDDYDGLNVIVNSFGDSIEQNGQDLYAGFGILVSVFYDQNMDGIDDGAIGSLKLIRIVVTTPVGDSYTYSVYRSNY